MPKLDELVTTITLIPGEELSTSLTINGCPETYTLLEERGHGRQGILYKAKREDGTVVAVKVLDRNPNAETQKAFVSWQKAGAVSCISRLLAHGTSSLDLKKYAVVSDYIDGVTLEELRVGTPLSEENIREILVQSATIIQEIHAKEVLHRDIKPSNIMIDRSGVVYITDFGVARSLDIGTLTGTVGVGTPLYFSPEQHDGKPDPRSEQYSLGLTLFYLMAGEHPALMPALDYRRDLPFEKLEEEYTPQLISIVRKMCEHDPEKRYTSLREMVVALESLEERVGEKSESTALVIADSALVPEVIDKRVVALRNEILQREKYLETFKKPSECLPFLFASLLGPGITVGTSYAWIYDGAPIIVLFANLAAVPFTFMMGEMLLSNIKAFKDEKKRLYQAKAALEILVSDKTPGQIESHLFAPNEERVYVLMPHTRTYAEGLHALRDACKNEQNPVHPKYRLSTGEEDYRSLTFKETFQAGVEDFWILKDANGRNRTFDERVALLKSYRNSCTGMAYPIDGPFFTIIPECKELIEIQRGFFGSSIPIEYAKLRTRGTELNRKKAKYNTHLTPEEIDNHEAWLTALEGDTRLLKAGREVVFAAYQQQYRRPLERGMTFYIYDTLTQDVLGALSVNDLVYFSDAYGSSSLLINGSFVQIAQSQKFLKQ